MKNELTPLTPEQSAEFDKSRHSDAVVQHKCIRCGAWYETPRGNVDQREKFICEASWQNGRCGAPMEYAVPALPVKTALIQPTTQDITNIGSGEDRLDTGMTVKEALKRAEAWWGKTGMREAQQQLKRQRSAVGGANNGSGSAFASQNPDDPNFLPSGLIHGQPWDALTKREKMMIVKAWHHFHIRKPDLLGEDGQAQHKMQDRKFIN